MRVLLIAIFCLGAVASAAEPECPASRRIHVDLDQWTKNVVRQPDLLRELQLKTGTARELPDLEQGVPSQRTLTILGVDDLKSKLTGGALPEHVIQVKYSLKIGKNCGDHEDHCFEGYAIQVLRPLGHGQWCAMGNELSAEIWGPDRDFEFCPDAKSPARDFAFFALTQAGRKVVQVDDFRAHCPSTGARSSSHERSYWEIQRGGLAQIFKIGLHAQSGGPDMGKLTTLKGHLTFSGSFPKRIHYEATEEDCGAGVFSEDARRSRSACRKSDRIQDYEYRDGHFEPAAIRPVD
jgi:hypothetical protein